MIYDYSVYVQVKNEDNLLPYFIEHYFKLNFQHIYIIDDNSLNPVSETEFIKKYIADGKITVLSLDFKKEDYFELSVNLLKSQYYDNDVFLDNKLYGQSYLLNLFMKRYKHENKWVFFCDIDEFLYLENFETIGDFLAFHEKKYDIHSIQFQWLMYGSSYHQNFPKNGRHLFENYILSEEYYNIHTKYICKINKTYKLDLHEPSINKNHKYIIKPNNNDLMKLCDFKQEYFEPNDVKSYNWNIKVGELNAFIAHFNILDLETFIERKVIRYRLVSGNFNANYFNYFNNIKSTFMLKYISNLNSDLPNMELDMTTSIDKYNDVYSTNFKNMDDMIMDSYYNKRKLVYDTIDNMLPLDFNVNNYKIFNKDLKCYNDKNIKFHYICYGKNENRIYKLELPDDFDVQSYKELNPDLLYLNDLDAKSHYTKCGKNENRIYKLELPDDFDVHSYKELNPDLLYLTDVDAKSHYAKCGKNENRIYKLDLPEDFDVKKYKILNSDIKYNLSDIEASIHYMVHGKNEKRLYNFDYDFTSTNNIDLKGKCVFFINHSPVLSGAVVFLYDLVLYLQNIFHNIIILDICYNKYIDKLYHTKLINKPIYYYNENEKLLNYIHDYNPIFIYSNSICIFIYNLHIFEKYIYKTIFHFHETLYYFLQFNNNRNFEYIKKSKIFVVSENIQKDYQKNLCFENVDIFKPFITLEKRKYIDEKIKESIPEFLNQDKVIFGMCGVDLNRKGYLIFLEVAKTLHEYNFVWVGGLVDKNIEINNIPNFIHIENTENPYKYINRFDYLLMTSLDDPCPIVLLEAMYLGISCIVFDKNVTYEHNINNYHIIKEHTSSHIDIIKYISSITIQKQKHNNLTRYILENFTIPSAFNYSIKKKYDKKIVLVAGFHYQTLISNLDYYIDIIRYIKLVHSNNIDIIVVINTSIESFNNNFDYSQEKDNIYLFGINKICDSCSDVVQKIKDIVDYIILKSNIGYDFGTMLVGIDFISSYLKTKYDYIMHIHSKKNDIWRNELFKIIHYDIRNYTDIDTISSKSFNVITSKDTDLNTEIIMSLPFIDKNLPDTYEYNGGKIFTTKLEYLNIFVIHFQYLYLNLTHSEKDDVYWQKYMDDKNTFLKYFKIYSDNILNEPIDELSHVKRKETNSRNYLELLKNGYRGIPDLQIEHAIERYIGYLTMYNKKVMLV